MADDLSTNVDASSELKRVRPTLYIALGGTGKEVLLRLRRRILETLWNGQRVEKLDDFKVASFLYFDLYMGKPEEDKKTASGTAVEDPLSALVDLPKGDCIQTRMDTGKYLQGREIERFPYVKEWLPAGDLRSIRTEDGAGQVRALSRLFFFDDVAKINDAINSKATALLNNVSNSEALQRLGVELEPQVQVIVICSVAGGTGSGSFIDMGYLAKSMQSVKLDGVSLYAVLGGAFADLNQRTRANSYAALMELDYCMQGNPIPPYVSRWTDTIENRAKYPYDNVYLVDSRNLGNQGTGDRGHLYRMIADVLFEDLRDPQLRGKKREDLVNQNTNYRLESFNPPMPEDLKNLSLAFSRAYSGVGQCTMTTDGRTQFDRDTAQAAHSMLTAFFRTEASDKVNTPKPGDCAELMRSALYIDKDYFVQDFPDFLNPKPSAIPDSPLTGRILTNGQTDTVTELRGTLREDFEQLRNALPNRSDWRANVEQLRTKHERDILGDITQVAQFGPRMLQLQEQANRIYADWNKPDGLRSSFYARIDNAELGGIVYTQRLIQQIEDQITVEKDGFIARTNRAAEQYEMLAKSLIEGFFPRALENLSKAVKKNWLGAIDNDAIDRCMQQLEASLFYYLQYKLRSAACGETIKLLNNLVRLLGQPAGIRGQAGSTGILGEIEQGSQSVALTLRAIDAEIKLLEESVRGAGPMSQVIRGGQIEGSMCGDYAAWGREALSSQGGSRLMFERLKKAETRAEIINILRGVARERMRDRESQLPTVLQTLADMNESDRNTLFGNAVLQALPWLNIDPQKMAPSFDGGMVSVFISVENAAEMSARFGDILQRKLPTIYDNKRIVFVSSSVRGRMVIYSELTGLALTAMIPLHDDWRRAYNEKNGKEERSPLHNDVDKARFRHPTAMSLQEMANLAARVQLFLRGVLLGKLRRRAADRNYEVDTSTNDTEDWLSVGNEQQIYLRDFIPERRAALDRNLRRIEEQLTPWQLAAYVALLEFTASQVYPKRVVKRADGNESRFGGLACVAVEQFRGTTMTRLQAQRSLLPMAPEALVSALLRTIASWTDEVPGSRADTTPLEADLEQAKEKRTIAWDRFSDAELEALVTPKPAMPAVQPSAAAPPQALRFHLAINDQEIGPLDRATLEAYALRGEWDAKTLAWSAGMAGWISAGEVPALAALLTSLRPPPLRTGTLDAPPPLPPRSPA
jgi:hypothetical protein